MLDKTIDSVLLALRADIIRRRMDGLEHVEALLRLRSVPLPPVRRRYAPRRDTMRIVLDALRDGPKDTAAVAAIAVAAGIPRYRARRRIWLTLDRLHKRGLVVRDGEAWGLR